MVLCARRRYEKLTLLLGDGEHHRLKLLEVFPLENDLDVVQLTRAADLNSELVACAAFESKRLLLKLSLECGLSLHLGHPRDWSVTFIRVVDDQRSTIPKVVLCCPAHQHDQSEVNKEVEQGSKGHYCCGPDNGAKNNHANHFDEQIKNPKHGIRKLGFVEQSVILCNHQEGSKSPCCALHQIQDFKRLL